MIILGQRADAAQWCFVPLDLTERGVDGALAPPTQTDFPVPPMITPRRRLWPRSHDQILSPNSVGGVQL